MDTSETYIKMCDCEEIQKLWKPTEADFMYNVAIENVCFIRVNRITDRRRKYHSIPYNKDRFIWLPRQDQLQEMYLRGMPDGTYQKIATLAEVFHDYHEKNGYPNYVGSMEQLWLAFVMKEKYNKVWNGKDWN